MKPLLYETLAKIAEIEDFCERAPEYGARAWRARGKYADIIFWDLGNLWCDIIKVTPKKGHEEWLQWFFDRVWETTDEETMGESDDDAY
jgi:hypothetical protein